MQINSYKDAGKTEGRSYANQKIKFPAIRLEPFSGRDRGMNFVEWVEVFGKASEHLSGQDRMLLLKSLLKPPASSVLAGIRISEASYDLILERLFKHYESDKLIINKYVKKLLILQAPVGKTTRNLQPKPYGDAMTNSTAQ